jgi:predicted transcriptional regulator
MFMSTTLSTKIDDPVYAIYQELSQIRDISIHNLAKKALVKYAENEIEYEKNKAEDMRRLDEYHRTGIAADGEKIMAWLEQVAAGNYTKWQP